MTQVPTQHKLPRPLTNAADELRLLRSRPGVNQRVVDMLRKELENGGARLRGVDLLAAYPPQVLVTEAGGRPGLLIPILATVRDLLVFAPIAITWWSLRGVLTAWGKSNYEKNLLEFWQSTDADVTRLSTAALYVVGVLLLVAVLTGVILVLNRHDGDSARSRERLTAALATAGLALAVPIDDGSVSAQRLSVTAGQLSTSTGQLVGALQTVGADLHTVANTGPGSDIRQALDEWRASAAALSKLGEGLTAPAAMVQDFVRLRTAVEAEEGKLRGAIQSLAERLEESTTIAVREGLGHTQVAQEVRASAQQLGLAVDRFLQRTDSLDVLVQQVQTLLLRMETNGLFPPGDAPERDNGDPAMGRGR